MPLLVNVFQGVVDFPELRGEDGEVATGICGNLLAAVDAGVFLYVGSYVLGNRVVMSEEVAKEVFHGCRFCSFQAGHRRLGQVTPGFDLLVYQLFLSYQT